MTNHEFKVGDLVRLVDVWGGKIGRKLSKEIYEILGKEGEYCWIKKTEDTSLITFHIRNLVLVKDERAMVTNHGLPNNCIRVIKSSAYYQDRSPTFPACDLIKFYYTYEVQRLDAGLWKTVRTFSNESKDMEKTAVSFAKAFEKSLGDYPQTVYISKGYAP